MNHLPPCCASCPELDSAARACRLLARPSHENRQRLLTMPCDLSRLIRLRFRGHGDDVAHSALSSWIAPEHDANTLVWSFGKHPRDARLWATAWPLRELVRAEVQRTLERRAKSRDSQPPEAIRSARGSSADPVLFARIAVALARIAQLDAVGFALLVESLSGRFQLAAWRDALGEPDDAILERRLLAIYRYAVLFFDLLPRIQDVDARAALAARRFTDGDPSEGAAVAAVRSAVGQRELAMDAFKTLYTRGALASFAALADSHAFGGLVGKRAIDALAQTLKTGDGHRSDEPADVEGVADDLITELASHTRAGGTSGAEEHVDPDRLAALAGASLDAPNVGPLARHLFLCDDGRCNALLRWEVGGREAVRRHLTSPLHEPAARQPGVALSESSAHVVHCRDVLWKAFTQMAEAQGRSIDELVDEAMARYQSVRDVVAPEPQKPVRPSVSSPRPRSSVPPPPVRIPVAPPIPSLVVAPRPAIEDEPAPSQPELPRVPTLQPAPPDHADDTATDTSEATPLLGLPIEPGSLEDADSDTDGNGQVASSPSTIPVPREWDMTPIRGNRAGPPDLRAAEDIAEETESSSTHGPGEDTSPKMNVTPLTPPLFAEYGGRRYHVAALRFVIGRERTTCHLVLPDANVSRQHAIVEWANGVYYLVDQGSTNGVGSGGHRIHRKQIIEGDTFDICGHSIRFSYRVQ